MIADEIDERPELPDAVHEQLYRSADVVNLVGCSHRELDYWSRLGLLRPLHPLPGPGTHRRWTQADIAVARILRRLMSLAPNRSDHARHATRVCYEALSEGRPLTGYLVVTPTGAQIVESFAITSEAAWVVPL